MWAGTRPALQSYGFQTNAQPQDGKNPKALESEGADFSYVVLKGLLVVDGALLDMRAIVVYRIHAVMQKLGYLAAVGYAQAYEGKDAHGRGQPIPFRPLYALLRAQQGVERLEEMGEEVQEG